jgi:outer membrane lipoprotein-sorting protein
MTIATRIILGSLAGATVLSTPVFAQAPEPQTIVDNMARVLRPEKASTSTLTFTVSGQHGQATKLVAKQARDKKVAGSDQMVTVMVSPAGTEGMTWLVKRTADQTVQWIYDPHIRRVRKIVPVEGFEAFLTSEYTYADLGLVDLHSAYKLLGEEQHDGARAYKIEAVPRNPWYYSRIVTWVAADSFAPLEREYYDAANALWKVEKFGEATTVDGVPTILHRRIEDRQAGGSTDLDVSAVHYDVTLPDELFDPQKLPAAASSRVWK